MLLSFHTGKYQGWVRYSRLLCCFLMAAPLLSLFAPNISFALQPLELTLTSSRNSSREFKGLEGLNFELIKTNALIPFIKNPSYAGIWYAGVEFTENRLFTSGVESGTRRLYRIATPIQYFPRRIGRFQHEWMLTPSYYSDESLTDQKRFTFEYAWQLRYFYNRKVGFVAGVRNDSRFGGAGVHPIIGMESRPDNRLFHHWVFPDMYTEIKLNRKLTAKAFLQVSGGNWPYTLANEAGSATMGLSDWKLGLGARLKTRMPFELVTEVGLRFMGEGTMAGVEGDIGNGFFVTIGIATPFVTQKSRKPRR